MATPQELVESLNTLVKEVEQVVASPETPSAAPVSEAASSAADDSEENKSYVRGYNDALKDMPAVPQIKDPNASRSASTSSRNSFPAPVVEVGEESEKNKSFVRGYNDALKDMPAEAIPAEEEASSSGANPVTEVEHHPVDNIDMASQERQKLIYKLGFMQAVEYRKFTSNIPIIKYENRASSELQKSYVRGYNHAVRTMQIDAEGEELEAAAEQGPAPKSPEQPRSHRSHHPSCDQRDAKNEQALTDAAPKIKFAEPNDSKTSKQYASGFNEDISHMTDPRPVSPGIDDEDLTAHDRVAAQYFAYWAEENKWSQLGYNNALRHIRGELYEKPGWAYEKDGWRLKCYLSGNSDGFGKGYSYLQGYYDAMHDLPQVLPKYGHTPFKSTQRASECCHCKDDHIDCECICDSNSEADAEDKEDDAEAKIGGICYSCSNDDRHNQCPCTCGKSSNCDLFAEYSGTCNHCKWEAIHLLCPCICGNSVTYGREEEFGIRPIVSTPVAGTDSSRTETPATEGARTESGRTETATSRNSGAETSRSTAPIPAREDEGEEGPRAELPALAALRKLLQIRGRDTFTRAIEIARQRQEERERERERQQALNVARFEETARNEVGRYLATHENNWFRHPSRHPSHEQRAEIFRARMRVVAVEFKKKACEYEEAAGPSTPNGVLNESQGFRTQDEDTRASLAAWAVELHRVADNAHLMAGVDTQTLFTYYLDRPIGPVLQSQRPRTTGPSASQGPTPDLRRQQRGSYDFPSQESWNDSATAESIFSGSDSQRSASSYSHIAGSGSGGFGDGLFGLQQWRGISNSQAQQSNTDCDRFCHERSDEGLYHY
ncbi:hypothetical protein N431DRAFT_474637 [Stipitochalara longipes BDJ]|nr:hypothetical protein N431DRAFT_474637 [Stipitochalara longipes BDJ]